MDVGCGRPPKGNPHLPPHFEARHSKNGAHNQVSSDVLLGEKNSVAISESKYWYSNPKDPKKRLKNPGFLKNRRPGDGPPPACNSAARKRSGPSCRPPHRAWGRFFWLRGRLHPRSLTASLPLQKWVDWKTFAFPIGFMVTFQGRFMLNFGRASVFLTVSCNGWVTYIYLKKNGSRMYR